MDKLTVYGIKNCDTMKKTFQWLAHHKVEYEFHDYKEEGADEDVLKRALAQHGWENVLNRKGTTWRALPDKIKEAMNERLALKTALDNPSIIRRPLLDCGSEIQLGFEEKSLKTMTAKHRSANKG